jgi:glycosyltransferase involved in cell wall biosynthesis
MAALAARVRGARTVLLVQDVYPEAIVAAGMLPADSRIIRTGDRFAQWLYRAVDRVVVLGRDMQRLAWAKIDGSRANVSGERVVIITNWADLEEIRPSERPTNALLARLGIVEKFVVQYSGNMGRTHDIESVLLAARELEDDPRFHFLLVGWGAKAAMVKRTIVAERRRNVTQLDPLPRSELPDLLNACDIAIIPFMPGMSGVSVPSRMYNVMAAGKPILAMANADSELALMVREHGLGWVVEPRDWRCVVATLRSAIDQPAAIADMGRRARTVVERAYSFDDALALYRELVARQLAS